MVSFLKMLPFVVFATVLVLFLIPLLIARPATLPTTFKASVENNLGYNIENTPNHQNTAINAAMGLHDDGKTGGALNSWGQYAKSGDIIFDVAGGLGILLPVFGL
jgi:hypothetical protein